MVIITNLPVMLNFATTIAKPIEMLFPSIRYFTLVILMVYSEKYPYKLFFIVKLRKAGQDRY